MNRQAREMTVPLTPLHLMKDVFRRRLEKQYYFIASEVGHWEGYPKQTLHIPRRELERLLYFEGVATMFKDPLSGQFLILPVTHMDIDDPWGEPTTWRAQGVGISSAHISGLVLNRDNAVLFRNDKYYEPTLFDILPLINEMVNIEFALRLNINALKMPFQFTGNPKASYSNMDVVRQIAECEPVIYADSFARELRPVEWNVTDRSMTLRDIYNTYDQIILEYLGVNCVNRDKAERLTAGEVTSNDQKIRFARDSRTAMREEATELLHEIYPELEGFRYVVKDDESERGDLTRGFDDTVPDNA